MYLIILKYTLKTEIKKQKTKKQLSYIQIQLIITYYNLFNKINLSLFFTHNNTNKYFKTRQIEQKKKLCLKHYRKIQSSIFTTT